MCFVRTPIVPFTRGFRVPDEISQIIPDVAAATLIPHNSNVLLQCTHKTVNEQVQKNKVEIQLPLSIPCK